jgi:hypothetical protein
MRFKDVYLNLKYHTLRRGKKRKSLKLTYHNSRLVFNAWEGDGDDDKGCSMARGGLTPHVPTVTGRTAAAHRTLYCLITSLSSVDIGFQPAAI